MADDLAALARKLDKLVSAVDGTALRRITVKVAGEAKKDALTVLARDVGADRAMRNWKRAKLNVGYKIVGNSAADLGPSPSGPWRVLDQGAKPHTVSAKGSRATGRGSRAINAARRAARSSGDRGAFAGSHPLKTPYGPRYSVKLKHTRGKRTWAKAQTVIQRETGPRVRREITKALREVF